MKQNKDLKDLPNKEIVKSSAVVDNFNVGYEGCGEGGWGVVCGIGTEIGLDVWGIFVDGLEVVYNSYKSCDYVKYTGDGPTYNLACPNLNEYLKKFTGL